MYEVHVIIHKNEIGYHIYQRPFWWLGEKYTPLLQTCHSYEDCIKWLDAQSFDYVIIEGDIK